MKGSIYLLNLPPKTVVTSYQNDGRFFVLETCLRTVILSNGPEDLTKQGVNFERAIMSNQKAYHYLLQILCGLRSELLGENEIVKQFKDAYQLFASLPGRDTTILHFLEKLLKDGKEIRTKHLLTVGQNSYAGVTRKILLERKIQEDLTILGTGNLTLDLIKNLKKHFRLTIFGRNAQRLKELHELFQVNTHLIGEDLSKALITSGQIINTIGTTESIIPKNFSLLWGQIWQEGTLIDLASPSLFVKEVETKNLFTLTDIFKTANTLQQVKESKLKEASEAITVLASRRFNSFLNTEIHHGTL